MDPALLPHAPGTSSTELVLIPRMSGGGKRGRQQEAGEDDKEQEEEEEDEDEETQCSGRVSAEHMRTLYSQHSDLALDRQLTKEEFQKHEQAWAATLIPGQHLNIRHQHLKLTNGYKLLLWCNSCEKR